ncbi:MAG: hypothetical protein II867_04425, partial [Clostridia bacterium]|nr:hypothetical protein [Clostridia bacterium]
TAGLFNLIQNALDSLHPGLFIEIDKQITEYTTDATGGFLGFAPDANRLRTLSNETYVSMFVTKMYGEIKDGEKHYMLGAKLFAHPGGDTGDGKQSEKANLAASLYIGGPTNLYLTDLDFISGLLDWIVGMFTPLALEDKSTSFIENLMAWNDASGAEKKGFVRSIDGDNATWDYPSDSQAQATTYVDVQTIVDGIKTTTKTVTRNATTHAAIGDVTTEVKYSYPLELKNLIEKVELNLFNHNGYVPYFTNISTSLPAASNRFVSAHIVLNKDAFNELLIFLYSTIFELFRDKIDGPDNAGLSYFVTGSGQSSTSNQSCESVLDGLNAHYKKYKAGTETVDDMVNYMYYYVKGISYTLEKTILQPLVLTGLQAQGGLYSVATYDLLNRYASDAIDNISSMLGTLLPIPFVSGNINPSINLYIDLDPNPSDYNRSGKLMLPGVQAIEIMINCKKTTAGTTLTKGTDWWFLRINPLSTVSDSDVDRVINSSFDSYSDHRSTVKTIVSNTKTGLLAFDEAVSAELVGSANIPTAIYIKDPATRTGNINSTSGASITITDEYIYNHTNYFPRRANVTFNDKGGASSLMKSYEDGTYYGARGTEITWDASSVDFMAPTKESGDSQVLAGYIYGYALNIVMYAI